MKFEWNPTKAASNRAKHGVTFVEAMTVFGDPLARIFDDPEQAVEAGREIIVGHSAKDRLLLVVFAAEQHTIRIISARRATRNERKDYEENVRS
jgi:hypothetical protein